MKIAQVCQPDAERPPRMLALPASSSRCMGCGSNSLANSMISSAVTSLRSQRDRAAFHEVLITPSFLPTYHRILFSLEFTLPEGSSRASQTLATRTQSQPRRLNYKNGSTADTTIRPIANGIAEQPFQLGHDFEIHAVDRGDQRRRQEHDSGNETILMMAFCSMLIMPSVASSRKVIFCDRNEAWSVRTTRRRDSVLTRAAEILAFLVAADRVAEEPDSRCSDIRLSWMSDDRSSLRPIRAG